MQIRTLLYCLAMALSTTALFAQGPSFNDGPYIFVEDEVYVAKWMLNNALQSQPLQENAPAEQAKIAARDFSLDFVNLQALPKPQKKIHFKTDSKIAALSDIHGQYDVAVKLLQANGIIDTNNDWSWGDGHLVIAGDVFDRGDQVTEIIWLIHKLEKQATQAGGRVHFLLGNHELMVLTGDLRYVHQKYRYTMAVFGMPLDSLLSPNTYLGAWLRSKPLAITINDMAFVHGGFSELLLEYLPDLEAINANGRAFIDAKSKDFEENPLLNLVGGNMGPVWYRGYFDEEVTKKQNAKRILKKLDVDHLVVGHTSHEAIISLFDHQIIGIDSSIKFGKSGEILIRENDEFFRGTIFGDQIKL